MAKSGTSTTTTVSAATLVIAWSITRRRKLMGGILMCEIRTAAVLAFVSDILCQTCYVKHISNYASRRLPSRNAPHHEPCQRVDHDGDKEERQANLDQSRKIQIAGRFGEFVGEHAGHGVSGSK